ncbi:DUF5817 domain-containing protein [Haloferacaceae archaeon DSL9]
MYAVVGCNKCANMWLLSDPCGAKTARCPRCRKQHQTKKLKRFFESEDRSAARQARAALLAKKHGDSAAFAEVAHEGDLERLAEDAGIDDREYLERSGLDTAEIEAAGSQATARSNSSKSRDEIVREAVEHAGDGGRPTRAAIVAYATDRDVPENAAEALLEKLTRRGDVSESGGRYRLV